MPAQVEISTPEVIIAPGDEELLEVRVRNLGSNTDTFSIAATGAGQSWAIVDPALVTLFPGAEQTVLLALRPPRRAAIPAGDVTMTIRVVPHNDPDEVATADVIVHILAFDERRLSFVQPVARARERAHYDLIVENDGNTRATCRLTAIDPTNRVAARFDPPSVAVEPGGREAVRVRISARRQRFAGQPLPHLFSVRATEEGHATAYASATFLQSALIPEKLGRRFILLCLLAGAVAGIWFGLLKPEVERIAEEAASEAVDARVAPLEAALATTPSSSIPAAVATTDPPADAAAPEPVEGVPWDQHWDITAPQNATTQTQNVIVDPGMQLQVTDVLWSNEALDNGTLSLLRNGDVVFEWALGSQPNFPSAFRNPIVVGAGGNLALRLKCDIPGDNTSTQCAVSFTMLGSQQPEAGSVASQGG
jgi:hypothetical protein